MFPARASPLKAPSTLLEDKSALWWFRREESYPLAALLPSSREPPLLLAALLDELKNPPPAAEERPEPALFCWPNGCGTPPLLALKPDLSGGLTPLLLRPLDVEREPVVSF